MQTMRKHKKFFVDKNLRVLLRENSDLKRLAKYQQNKIEELMLNDIEIMEKFIEFVALFEDVNNKLADSQALIKKQKAEIKRLKAENKFVGKTEKVC